MFKTAVSRYEKIARLFAEAAVVKAAVIVTMIFTRAEDMADRRFYSGNAGLIFTRKHY